MWAVTAKAPLRAAPAGSGQALAAVPVLPVLSWDNFSRARVFTTASAGGVPGKLDTNAGATRACDGLTDGLTTKCCQRSDPRNYPLNSSNC